MNSFFKQRIQSFGYAFRGIATMFRETPNAWIHLCLTLLALSLGWMLDISEAEWLVVVLVIGLVFACEAINTALENLADFACNKQIDPIIKKVKDMSAGAVLIAAMAALVVGIWVFLPRLLHLLY